ncbi:class II aldolase/adducin family protein [Paracidovorax konjaci]|uniref:Ribulose-5-phosphate 4-epimerase/Fuculose-1-phosphate aldolase n=1 Tax=Paracidovorax konjaci TaxID=32040 RepID=A0A1I1VUB2_9BURK|nr:class II aldolase/adducin family protein [Paracidovorax konjaci]SFD86445.1 Ribulose-5-phosphate 4-epimerase/Fuculose-1-phosphate aldolase [Paracidovorax konjaci]
MNATTAHATAPDVRGQVSPQEWQTRIELAAAYRLVAHFGWDDLIFTHISARVPGEPDRFLINPYGMLFDEITASSLVKVDHHGEPVMATDYDVNPAGFLIHSAIHDGRPEVQCVLHTHTQYGVAVSAQEGGLLPISQQSIFPLAQLAYHDYEGVALRDDERPRLVADLGTGNYLVLRNHGLLTCGRSVPEALLAMYTLESACRIQILAQAGGGALTRIPADIVATSLEQSRQVTKGKGAGLAWPGLLRRLDRIDPSYRN